MNRKQVIVLLLALVVIGGASLMLLNRHEESWTTADTKLGQKVLPNFQINDVAAMRIKGETELNLVKKDDRWRVQERNDYPANFSDLSELLITLGDLKIAQAEPIGSSQLDRMHLTEPGSGPDAATLIEFKDGQGKVLQSLLLGKKHMHKSERPGPFGDNEMPDGRYVMLKSDPHEVLTVSDPLVKVDPKPATWLDKTFFKVEKPQTITFTSTNAAESWSLARESEGSRWVLLNLKAGEVLDTNKVSSLSSTLSYPSFVDVSTESAAAAGLNKPLVVTITTFDHFTYTLKIGSQNSTQNYDMNVAVTADLETNRIVGKNEKPDEAKKIDKIFHDHLEAQQKKLKQEQALAQWTYVVNNWLINPLIRPRAELMVEKESEKKGDKNAASASMREQKSDADNLFPLPDPNR